jgi:magnesium-transporting ATPase (P-type)
MGSCRRRSFRHAHDRSRTVSANSRRRRSRGSAARCRGRRPAARTAASSSANVFTLFNAILAAFGALTLLFGDPRDALFLGIVIANSAIGIVQEVRAKRTLDRLSALVAPTATVISDGRARRVPVEDVVVGDAVPLEPGDQLIADAVLVEADGLRLDESILTGESEPVVRGAGDEVRSGSFVVEGPPGAW